MMQEVTNRIVVIKVIKAVVGLVICLYLTKSFFKYGDQWVKKQQEIKIMQIELEEKKLDIEKGDIY